MRFLILFFVLLSVSINAQDQKIDAINATDTADSCSQVVKGEVRDKITNELLPETIITLTDSQGNPIETQMTLEDAVFSFNLDCETTYIITASRDSYTSQSKEFTTTSLAETTLRTVISLDKGRIDFIKDSVKAEATELADINPNTITESIEVKETPLAQELTPVKETSSVIGKQEDAQQSDRAVKQEEVLTRVVPEVETVKNSENKDVLVIKPVFFEYESSYLTKQAKKELLKVVDIMKKNPDLVIQATSHTDAKGPEKYNMWMSERRAKRTIEYIIKRGIDRKRISGKGYGESKLINDCTEGDDCTDEQRAINRRTEFVVVKK